MARHLLLQRAATCRLRSRKCRCTCGCGTVRNLAAWTLTACSLGAGFAAGYVSGDWSWFSRSGAAVVAVGIVLTSQQILDHNRRLLDNQRRENARSPTSAHHGVRTQDWAGENSMRRLIRARSEEEDLWRSEFSGFHMLVGGTLIWGFGDLVGLLLSHCCGN